MARAHYENFPVASWLLPAAMRPHVAAVYASLLGRLTTSRTKGRRAVEDRPRQAQRVQRRLHAAVADYGNESSAASHAHEDLIIVALAHSIRTLICRSGCSTI
jgi:phytoene/squalene synthetase